MYDLISGTRILHVDRPSEANVRLVEFAFEANKIISFDFGYYAPFYRLENVLNIVKKATIVKTSSIAASLFLKTNQLKSFREIAPNARLYINTLGVKGIEGYVVEKSSVLPFSKPALPCPRFLESGGAGDAFHAGLLYKVLEEGIDALVGSLQETLDFSQALASLCCMFLGARGYLISKLKNSTLPDIRASIISDVENLIRGNVDHIMAFSSGVPEPRMPWVYNKADFCLACGRATRPLAPCYYELSLDAVPTFMADAFRRFLGQEPLDITPNDKVHIVGSGGSFSASVFFQLLLNDYVGASAFAMAPYDFLEFGKPNSKIVLVSYGGNNPDIISAYNRTIDIGAQRIYAITASQTSKLSRLVRSQKHGSVYCVTDGNKDRGFVSTIGMLSTMAAMCSLLEPSLGDPSLPVFFGEPSLRDFFASAKAEAEQKLDAMSAKFSDLGHRHIVALGSGWAWPALVDFESKITEGGVSTIEISETKNYTHGRYINAYRNKGSRLFVLLSTSHDTALADFLESRFSKDFPTVVLHTSESGLKASVELTVKQLYLTNAIAKSRGIDIARPYFPQEARGLYSWGPIYEHRESGKKSNV
jgi:fructoselysine-6-P-deglycase FrlB-like protein